MSYSHKDRRLFDEFRTMIAPAIHTGMLDIWDDTMIRPGSKWKDEITKALRSARVAVLLVSSNFLASDFIVTHELPYLLHAAENKGLTVFWVLLSDCLYQTTEIIAYQAAHDVAKPLDTLKRPQRKTALRAICTELINVLQTTEPVAQAQRAMDDRHIDQSRDDTWPKLSSDAAALGHVIYRRAPLTYIDTPSDPDNIVFELFRNDYKSI